MKKIFNKSLSLILSMIMMLSSVVVAFTGLTLTASAAKPNSVGVEKKTDKVPGDILFVVPEQIYLYPDGLSWKNETYTQFQYFVNNSVTFNSSEKKYTVSPNTPNGTAQETIGKIYLNVPNASNISLSVSALVDDGLATASKTNDWVIYTQLEGGSAVSASAASPTFNYSSSIPSNAWGTKTTINITTSGRSAHVAADKYGYYLRWNLSYTDTTTNSARTAVAYTYVYKPYTVPVMAWSTSRNEYYNETYASHILWISGMHSIYSRTGTNQNEHAYKEHIGGDEFGTGFNSAAPYTGSPTKNSNNPGLAGWISTSQSGGTYINSVKYNGNGVSHSNSSVDNGDERYVAFGGKAGPYTNDVSMRTSWDNDDGYKRNPSSSSYKYNKNNLTSYWISHNGYSNLSCWVHSRNDAVLSVDTSRYSNLEQIPNLSLGLVATSDEKCSNMKGKWSIGDSLIGSYQDRCDWEHTDDAIGDDWNHATASGGSTANNYQGDSDHIIAWNGGIAAGGEGYDKDYKDKNSEGDSDESLRYAGKWPRKITGTGDTTMSAHGMYLNMDSNDDQITFTEITMQLKKKNKADLRAKVYEVTSKFNLLGVNGTDTNGKLQSIYFQSDSNYQWSAFADAYKAAVVALTTLESNEDMAELTKNLTNKYNALKTCYYLDTDAHASYTTQPTFFWNVGSNATTTSTTQAVSALSNSKTVNISDLNASYKPTIATGYKMRGWSLYPNGINPVTNTTDIKSSGTFTVGWNTPIYFLTQPKQTTYTFAANDSTGSTRASISPTTVNVTYDANVNNTISVSRTGYTFGGFYNGTALTDQVFKPQSATANNVAVWAKSQPNTYEYREGTQTLTAKWTPKTYTILFDVNGGNSVQKSSISVTFDSAVPSSGTAAKTGYLFTGYYSARTGGNRIFDQNGAYQLGNYTIDGNTQTYAQWSPKSFNVRFDANGGSSAASQRTVVFDSAVADAAPATRTGYSFEGYYTSPTGGTQVFNAQGKYVPNNGVWKQDNTNGYTYTYYARWTANTYLATFLNENGSEFATRTIYHDGVLTQPSASPTKASDDTNEYTFAAWQVNGQDYVFSTLVTGDLTLTPRFTSTPHVYDNGTVTHRESCMTPGEKEFRCTNPGCGYVKKEIIPAVGHHVFTDDSNDTILLYPTCETDGTKNAVCDRDNCDHTYGYTVSNAVIGRTGHNFTGSNYETTTPATCTSSGVEMDKCTNVDRNTGIPCAAHDSTTARTINPTGHNFVGVNKNDPAQEYSPANCRDAQKLYKVCTNPGCGAYANGITLDENGAVVPIDTFDGEARTDNHCGPFNYTANYDDDGNRLDTHTATCQFCNRVDTTKTACHGGHVDCKDRAVCDDCNEPYGEVSSTHSGPYSYRQTRYGYHEKYCTYCNRAVENEEHCVSDNTATCQQKAHCTLCHEECGSLADHSYTVTYTPTGAEGELCSEATCRDKAKYFNKCQWCDLKSTDETETFEYGDYATTHVDGYVSYEKIPNTDTHYVKCDYCHNAHIDALIAPCHGGTTTCTTAPICDDCHESYGEPHSHTYDEQKEWADAFIHGNSCLTDSEYYFTCSECHTAVDKDLSKTWTKNDHMGHNFEGAEWSLQSAAAESCETSAIYARYCTRCHNTESGGIEYETRGPLGHAFDEYTPDLNDSTTYSEKDDATCMSSANYWKRCTRDGCTSYANEVDAQYIPTGTVLYFSWGDVNPDGHKWIKDDTVQNSCTQQGYTNYHCEYNAAHTKPDDFVAAKGHHLVDYTPDDALVSEQRATTANCVDVATYYTKCVDCGLYSYEITDKSTITAGDETFPYGVVARDVHKHLVPVNETDSTCFVPGHYAYELCDECNRIFYNNTTFEANDPIVLKPLLTSHTGPLSDYRSDDDTTHTVHCGECDKDFHEGHHYDNGVETRTATCTAQQQITYTCGDCGHQKVDTLAIDPANHNGHRQFFAAVDSTCNKKGNDAYYYCEACGKFYDANENEISGKPEKPLDFTNHENRQFFGETQSSCAVQGHDAYYYCNICGKYYDANENEISGIPYRDLVPTAHPTASVQHHDAVLSNCTSTGNYEYDYCTDCNTYTITIKGNVIVTEDATLKVEPVESDRHSYGDWVVTTEPTCAKTGEKTKTCAYNGDHKIKETIPATENHQMTEWEDDVKATCTQKGQLKRHCTGCDLVEYKEVAALGHNWGEWTVVTPATCNQKGVEQRVCANDPTHIEKRDIPATGKHTDADGDKVCDDCGGNIFVDKKDCGCICHQIWNSKFAKIIYKISLVFWRLFRINRVCACGEWHYFDGGLHYHG